MIDTGLMCGGPFQDFIDGTILPLTGAAVVVTAILIALSYMASKALSNPKLSLWAKTELIQLGISLFTITITVSVVLTFCNVNISEIGNILGLTSVPSSNIFQAAGYFLRDAVEYSHNAMVVTRYQLEAYTILSYYSGFICDYTVGRVGFGCWFGWGGENMQPYGGYGAGMSALNIVYNSLLITFFTTLAYVFVLIFVYKGFVFFFLPVGLFVRCLPYMRNLGSVLLSIGIAFMVIYPGVLAIFYLMEDVLFEEPEGPSGIDSSTFSSAEASLVKTNAEYFAMSTWGEGPIKNAYLGVGNCYSCDDHALGNVPYALEFAGHAYVASGFFPTLALLATIASVAYLARLYGDEVDLSRLVQMI